MYRFLLLFQIFILNLKSTSDIFVPTLFIHVLLCVTVTVKCYHKYGSCSLFIVCFMSVLPSCRKQRKCRRLEVMHIDSPTGGDRVCAERERSVFPAAALHMDE